MKINNVSIHCEDKGSPNVEIHKFDDFCSIKIGSIGNSVDYYLATPEDVIDFKDIFMDAYHEFYDAADLGVEGKL